MPLDSAAKIIVTRLGSHKRPAVVRVSTQERAQELIELCRERDWQLIVGIEPDEPEDVTDVLKLLEPDRFTVRAEPTAGRNDPCPCGSGVKYKKCCLRSSPAGAPTSRQQ
jgi:SWIM/SEC-C metal-binding protein